MKQNRILLCAISFLMIFNILVPVLHAQPASEMSEEERNKKIKDAIQKLREEKEKTRHPKVEHILTELEDAYKKGAEEAAKKFNAGEVLKDDNGVAITKLEDAEKKGGGDAAKEFAKKRGLEIKGGNKTPVRLTLGNGLTAETFDKKLLESYGGEDIGGWGRYLGADIPIGKIRKIADEVEGIIWIERPTPAVPESFRSEGLSKVGFSNYSAAGIRGSGVKIAVVDTGFYGLTSATSNGDLPENVTKIDCSSRSLGCKSDTFSSEGTEHGTAVAEIIYDMAKDAQLYLVKVNGNDQETLKNAVAYCRENNVKIINNSMGWPNTNFNDGKCWKDNGYYNPVCSVNDAYGTGGSNDILFVKSAGNYGEKHYSATFDGTDYHQTTPGVCNSTSCRLYPGEQITVYLTWDDWYKDSTDTGSDQDYDIYLFDNSWSVPTGCQSTGSQTGSQTPTERFSCIISSDEYPSADYPNGEYFYLYIVNYNASSNHKFKVYSYTHDLSPYTSAGSISSPADAEHAMAVGAIHHTKYTTGSQESYSSQGPTTDNRKKPEITGPDGVSTYSYGASESGRDCELDSSSDYTTGFCGTSAAAPHVAGAAALLLSQNQNYTVSQLWSALTGSATDMGDTGQDNIYGYGRLNISHYELNTSKGGTGTGTVTSSPSGISCGSDCTDSWFSNTSITLTATADSTSNFSGWSGGGCSGTGSCTVKMDGDKTVTANFDLPTMTVSKSGTGSGTVTSSPSGISCGSDCTQDYNKGTSVTLTATADSTSNFAGWSGGGCSGTGSCTVTMNSDTSVTASFDLPTLTVSKTGIGTGTVTSSPSGISCGSDCTQDYNKGTSVTLTATADSAWDFTGWSGSCSGTGSCPITMSSDTSATAGFGCLSPTVKILGKAGYPTLQAAYNSAVPGDIIQARAATFTENITANRDIPVTIDGGFNCHWTSNSGGTTTLNGQLTLNSGKVTVKNFILQ